MRQKHVLPIENVEMGIGTTRKLLEWLDTKNRDRRNRSIERLMIEFANTTRLKEVLRSRKAPISGEEIEIKQIKEGTNKINKELSRIRVFPQFLVTPWEWYGTWLPIEARGLGEQFGRGRNAKARLVGHANAVIILVNLAREGRLDRIRQCSQCEKWFYTSRRRRRFCQTECQQRSFRATPQFKSQRREYMRKYRENVTSSPSRRFPKRTHSRRRERY